MSKSLSHIFVPALGGTAIVLGGAFGLANRDYAGDEISSLKSQVIQLEERANENARAASDATERATVLELEIAEVQSRAETLVAAGGSLTLPAPKAEGTMGLGRLALAEEVAAWDVDVLPDGRGLPTGSGDVLTGEEVFADKCASCHGDFAEGVDNWPVLAGGFDTLADEDPVKTVGSYWPYLSTVWDYVHRSMPFGSAQTITADETYAIVAYILYSNDLVDEEFELSDANFTDIELPNAGGFVIDDRAETEYAIWSKEPCMSDCKTDVEITRRASDVNVTPMDDVAEETQIVAAATTASDTNTGATQTAAVDPEMFAKGEKAFKKCKACHKIGEGAKNGTGPQLNGIMGRGFAAVDGFKYSNAFKDAGAEGRVWTEEEMAGFLTKPKAYIPGTKMSFNGFKKQDDIDAIIVYLTEAGK